MSGPSRDRLAALPRAERHDALAATVERELRAVMRMEASEPLPAGESFFDVGLTSLGIEETKQRLEAELGCRIEAEILFNHPTLDRLVAHLERGALAELFGGADEGPAAVEPAEVDDEKALVDDMLARIYRA